MKKKKKYEKPVLKIIEVELSCCIAASPFVVHDGSWGGRSN